MPDQTTPTEHSDLVGGSTAARRIACPASYALEQRVPKDDGSIYAREGTALHEVMTVLLEDPDVEVYDILPFEFTHKDGWTYTVDEDLWDTLGAPALDAFLDFMEVMEQEHGDDFDYIVEKSMEFPGIPGAFGTGDVVWRCGSAAGVWDWKFGQGRVSAEENSQLLFYACAARNTFPEFFRGAEEIHLSIMQPALSEEDDTWIAYLGDLDDFETTLKGAVAEIREHGAEARMQKGEHCKFARCKAICPLFLDPAQQFAAKIAALSDAAEDGKIQNEPSFVDDLPALMDLAEIARDWARDVMGHAQRLAEEDEDARAALRDGGWILKPKRAGAREWAAEEKTVVNVARYRGLKADDIYKKTLISPTQMEKALKKLGQELPEKYVRRPAPSGATLTRDDGHTEEYQSATDKAAALADRLAHLR